MGEVYRARDSRLGREVAIKVLPTEMAADCERLERFEREARSASALTHPNIVTIYELGQVESTRYIAMELVEGHTLRELLNAGPIPMRDVVQIVSQIADGLAKAHEAGIVHRDLKPENLMITTDGQAKILDFGLAKIRPTDCDELSQMSTVVGAETRPGVLLGTVRYMSPEQVRGQPVDFRTDQFSLGSVLYEMITGTPPVRGNTAADMISEILQSEPEAVASLNREAPAPLCWTIERCLAKDAEKRYLSTRDLAQDFAAIRDRFSQLTYRHHETRPSNLPIQLTAFIGREKEVATLKELLLRPDVMLVTADGPGGVGKTRLALQVAEELVDQFPGGVYCVPLAAITDPTSIPSLIAQTVGLRETGVQPEIALHQYLQSSLSAPTLLVLDNFEHLLNAAQLVAELLALRSSVKILVTSRAPLHIYGEYEFPVPPLAVPDPKALPPPNALLEYSALALFAERATAVKPDFKLTQENASAVSEICAHLDGLPLAIELAAARIKLLSPAAMQKRLASRLQLLTGGGLDRPARQQTLRGAIDWSYDLLTPAEQQLFRRLSVFVSGCTLEAVEAVCNTKGDLELDPLEGMASMVDKSLLRQIEPLEGESRFMMLETIREYGLEKLSSSGEEVAIRRGHAAYFLVLAEEGASDFPETERTDWLNRLEVEHDNLRSALEWLIDSKGADWGLRLGGALFRFWETREYLAEGRDLLGKLLSIGEATPNKVRARALFASGVLAGVQGDYVSANKSIEESLLISQDLGDQNGMAVALNALAVLARTRGDLAASRALQEKSLALWTEIGDQKAVARCLSNLSNVVRAQGDYVRARSLSADCLSIFRELGDRTGIAWALNYQGDVARGENEYNEARLHYEQSLKAFQELGDKWGIAGSLADLGNLARDEKDFDAAESLYHQSLRMFHELDHKRGIARLLECLACLTASQTQPERSLRLAGAAASLRQALGAPLTPDEQAKLERLLEPARQATTQGATAWLDGWVLPLEKAIDEALRPATI